MYVHTDIHTYIQTIQPFQLKSNQYPNWSSLIKVHTYIQYYACPTMHSKDLKRDFYLTAAEAAAYGLIDKVLLPHQVAHAIQLHIYIHIHTYLHPWWTSAYSCCKPITYSVWSLSPRQPIKMMRYRGEDDDVVGFGHFSEVRRVKSGPSDVIVPIKARKLFETLIS